MAGISEILFLLLLIACVLILPGLIRGGGQPTQKAKGAAGKINGLSVWFRIAIVLSFAWPVSAAVYTRPWTDSPARFIIIGCLPVVSAWAAAWIFAGFKKK